MSAPALVLDAPPLTTDYELVAAIKVVQKLFKSCNANTSGGNAKILDATITAAINEYITKGAAAAAASKPPAMNMTSLNSANQCRYFRAIISAIFDLETPITPWKISILSEIFGAMNRLNLNDSERALVIFVCDKLVLYHNLLDTQELKDFIKDKLVDEIFVHNIFLNNYYFNSSFKKNPLLLKSNSNPSYVITSK